MIKRYKRFSIFKRKEIKNEKAPGYDVLVSDKKEDGSYDNYTVGGVWLQESNGNKYFSARLKETAESETGGGFKVYPGYSIVSDVELDGLINKLQDPNYPVAGIDKDVPVDDIAF